MKSSKSAVMACLIKNYSKQKDSTLFEEIKQAEIMACQAA
jgi:hypothetical protein